MKFFTTFRSKQRVVRQTIVFTQTKRDADEVSMALTNSIASEALHGDISQHQRERTLNGFRQAKFTVLVATDVAARGLDIPNVDLVRDGMACCADTHEINKKKLHRICK